MHGFCTVGVGGDRKCRETPGIKTTFLLSERFAFFHLSNVMNAHLQKMQPFALEAGQHTVQLPGSFRN